MVTDYQLLNVFSKKTYKKIEKAERCPVAGMTAPFLHSAAPVCRKKLYIDI